MRSILKHPHLSDLQYQHCPEPFPFATSATVEVSPRVHFPPTPTLTSIFITHSSSVYDRTPAEVPPNVCALPGRHEREFVETPYPRPRRKWECNASDASRTCYFQPRGPEPSGLSTYFSSNHVVPNDLSPHARFLGPPSDSEDSDVVRTPPESTFSDHAIAVRFGPRNTSDVMMPYPPTQEEIESALLFLPRAAGVPSKKGTRRSSGMGRSPPKEPRRQSADGRIPRNNDFSVPNLDFEGCLGGF